MNTNTKELNLNEMEMVSGGFFVGFIPAAIEGATIADD